MAIVDYEAERGWFDPRVVPYGPLALDPAAAVLALRAGDVRRAQGLPRRRRARCASSASIATAAACTTAATRLCMPADRRGADARGDPGAGARRPRLGAVVGRARRSTSARRIIATEPFLGVRPAKRFLFFVIASPVGAYGGEAFSPARILVEDKYVRAAVGRARRRQGGRELHRQPARRRGRQGARLRAGAVDRRRRAHATSKRSAP